MKKLIALVVIMIVSCTTPEIEQPQTADLERRPVQCGEAVIPDGINRQDIIDRLNSTGEIINGFSEREVIITHGNRGLMFGHLFNAPNEVIQYNFTISESGAIVDEGCVKVDNPYSVFYDFRAKNNRTYTVTFNDYPEVTRVYTF